MSHSRYHKNYDADDLYYILLGAAHYLQNSGMNLISNEVNKNPFELEDMKDMIAIAFAEHRTGRNQTDGYARNVEGAKNANGTYDHGLWQINLNQSNFTYLTSSQGPNGVNANIPMFVGLSKEELKDLMYDPFANAVAAIAIAQLTVGREKDKGINNWSTAGMISKDKTFYQEASKNLDTHLGFRDWEKDYYDRKVQESYNVDLAGITPPVQPPPINTEQLDKEAEIIFGRSDYSNLNFVDKAIVKNIIEPVTNTYNNKAKPLFSELYSNFKSNFERSPIDRQFDYMENVYDK